MEFEEIYARHAAEYDALVTAEDCERNLVPALEAICTLRGAAVLEVGVGTGRIARAIMDRVGRLVGVDRAPAMLELARGHLERGAGETPWELHCADARALPVATQAFDVAIAGWVFGHLRSWMPQDWRAQIALGLQEMRRALRPGGTLVVVETLGTGSVVPHPPTPELEEYVDWLEREQGLERRAIRTDYQFSDVETAATVTGFFFGDDFATRVRGNAWSRVPECTGIWWGVRD